MCMRKHTCDRLAHTCAATFKSTTSQKAAHKLVRAVVQQGAAALRNTIVHCVRYHMHSATSQVRVVDLHANPNHAFQLFKLIAATPPTPGHGYPSKKMVDVFCTQLGLELDPQKFDQLRDHLE